MPAPSKLPLTSTVVMLIIAFSLGGCSEAPPSPHKPLVRPAKIFHVADPAQQAFRNFPAEVEANTNSQLAFRVSGQIIDFPVKAGYDVEQGQVLARLDPKDFKLLVDDRQARYELAKSQFERAQILLKKKLASQSDYDEAKANLAVALSTLNAAKIDLDYTSLRAPFAGTIARVMAENHENIQAKQAILELQNRERVDISIQMPEDIISRVHRNTDYQPTVSFDSHPDQHFLVSIKEYDTQADPSTLTYKVVFSMLTPTTFNVLPGMTANIRIDLSKVTDVQQNRFLLPVESVFAAEDAAIDSQVRYLWKMDPQSHRVSRQEVTVGQITQGGIEVFSGVNPGDQIIAAGVHFLSEGMQVRPWNREEGL